MIKSHTTAQRQCRGDWGVFQPGGSRVHLWFQHLRHLPLVSHHFWQDPFCLVHCFPKKYSHTSFLYSVDMCVIKDFDRSTLLFSRYVVPASRGVRLLLAPYPSVGHRCPSLSTNQRGPKVGLAACHPGHVHQQVSRPVTPSPREDPTDLYFNMLWSQCFEIL